MTMKVAFVLRLGVTCPLLAIILLAILEVAASILLRRFSLTPSQSVAATAAPYRYTRATPQNDRLSAISLSVDFMPAPAAVQMHTPCLQNIPSLGR